jgi:hypothetical protein
MCPHDAIIQERAAAIQKYLRDSKRSAHAPMSWRRRTGIHQACERKVFLGQSAPQAQAFFEPIALDNKAPAHRPFLGSAQVVTASPQAQHSRRRCFKRRLGLWRALKRRAYMRDSGCEFATVGGWASECQAVSKKSKGLGCEQKVKACPWRQG